MCSRSDRGAAAEAPGVAPHYQLELTREAHLDQLAVKVECVESIAADGPTRSRLQCELQGSIKAMIGISTQVVVCDPGSIERSTGKARRGSTGGPRVSQPSNAKDAGWIRVTPRPTDDDRDPRDRLARVQILAVDMCGGHLLADATINASQNEICANPTISIARVTVSAVVARRIHAP